MKEGKILNKQASSDQLRLQLYWPLPVVPVYVNILIALSTAPKSYTLNRCFIITLDIEIDLLNIICSIYSESDLNFFSVLI